LLQDCGLPVAFYNRLSATEFRAPLCEMLKMEVVFRRRALGSFLQRNPGIPKGTVFPRLVFELFLKTSGKKWGDHVLPCDDPLMVIGRECAEGDVVMLYNPHQPIHGQKPFLTLPFLEVFPFRNVDEVLFKIEEIGRRHFLILERAWSLLGREFADIKIEFGVPADAWTAEKQIWVGKILLADVIDADSWRVLYKGGHEDKQFYREGGDLGELGRKYKLAAGLTDRFGLPLQQIIVWTGSPRDDVSAFKEALLSPFEGKDLVVTYVALSAHKETIPAVITMNQHLADIPDSVIIDYVGMSNGAGGVLAANSTVPVINVPANAPGTDKPFPDDVWSSLRMPSQVPAMTVLSAKNAVLAALQILAMRNPRLYSMLRYEQESRLVNVVEI